MIIPRIKDTARFKLELDGETIIFVNEEEILKYWQSKYKFAGYCGFKKDIYPFKKGDIVTIPKGTYVETTGGKPSGPAKKTYKVKVDHIICGCHYADTKGYVIKNPELRWAGTGGYWHGVDINEVLEMKNVK